MDRSLVPFAFLLSSIFLGSPLRADDEVSHLTAVRAALEKGDAASALAAATLGLEFWPEQVDLLELASKAAEKAKQPDIALWYAHLALDLARQTEEAEQDAEVLERLAKRVIELDPLNDQTVEVLDGFAEELIKVADSAQGRKLYANAVDLYTRCADTSLAAKVNKKLERFYGNKKAVEVLLASGLDVPVRRKERFSPERLASMNAKASNWEKAFEFKGKNYTIKTNMGYEIGRDMSQAMEQVSSFYIKVFGEKPGRRCWISVYKLRAEFDQHEGSMSPSIKGFFRPGKNYVATYDPASDGRPINSLWSTLFHEASHQFTDRALTGTVPTWLNEGTASYFEGARLQPGGTVETNLIPDTRLRGLRATHEEDSPRLKDVIAHKADGSYPGSYYPMGWGLVYFLHNYENDQCERVYLPLYQAYMRTYRSGREHDVVDRFEEYFIKRAKQPEVKSLEDFDQRFKTWISELYDIHFGPASQADVLIERARKQRKFKTLEAAAESYQWALRKRSTDPVAAFELAEVFEERGLKDEAIYTYRKAWRLARELDDPEGALALRPTESGNDLVALAQERVGALDRGIAAGVAESEQLFVTATAKLATDYVEKGLPRRSLRVLDEAQSLIGEHPQITETRESILAQNDVDVRRWRRLPLSSSFDGWLVSKGAWTFKEETLRGESTSLKYAFYPEPLPIGVDARFEVEVDIESPVPDAMLGLAYAVDPNGEPQLLVIDGSGLMLLFELTPDGPAAVELIGRISPARVNKPFVLAVEIEGGTATYWLGDQKIGSHDYDPSELQGGVGVFVQDSNAAFRNLRVRY